MTKRGKSIMGKYFGTDGIRGVANVELDAGLAYRAGFAAATVLTKNLNRRAKIYIGRDTRISGDMLEASPERTRRCWGSSPRRPSLI